MSEKIVYILGAGFSMNAGAPSQSELIQEIYNLEKANAREDEFLSRIKRFIKEAVPNYCI